MRKMATSTYYHRLSRSISPNISHRQLLFRLGIVLITLFLIVCFYWELNSIPLQKVTDTRIQTWVFVAHDLSPQVWVDMTKRCVVSALKYTSLRPVCIFYGSPSNPLITWLQTHDVEVVYHTPSWAHHIESVVNSDIGRQNTKWSPLYASSVGLVATFLRLDLPIILTPEKHGSLVLYTDTDVIFRRMPTLDDFAQQQAPDYFVMGTEGGKKYHKKHDGNINAGVMLINIPNMKHTYHDFMDWVFSSKNLARGLHFGKYGPGDQGAYNEYYANKFPIIDSPLFNWKPYWGYNDQACIVHFHGAKPKDYELAFRSEYDGNQNFKVLFKWCKDNSVSTENDCLKWIDEFEHISLD